MHLYSTCRWDYSRVLATVLSVFESNNLWTRVVQLFHCRVLVMQKILLPQNNIVTRNSLCSLTILTCHTVYSACVPYPVLRTIPCGHIPYPHLTYYTFLSYTISLVHCTIPSSQVPNPRLAVSLDHTPAPLFPAHIPYHELTCHKCLLTYLLV